MTHEEYVALQRVEIIHTAKNILQGTMDITEGVRFLYNNWREAELPRETTEYLFIIGVEDDLDHIPKGEERKKYTAENLQKIDQEEEEILKFYKESLIEICNNIIEHYANGIDRS